MIPKLTFHSGRWIDDDTGNRVAEIYNWSPNYGFMGKLFELAPDMLEALQAVSNCVYFDDEKGRAVWELDSKTLGMVRDVLEKIKAETPPWEPF